MPCPRYSASKNSLVFGGSESVRRRAAVVREDRQAGQAPRELPQAADQTEREASGGIEAESQEDGVEAAFLHADAGGHEEEEAFHQDGEDGDRERRPGGNRSAEKRHDEADFDSADDPGAEEEEDGESERERALPHRAKDIPVEIAEESLARTAAGEDPSDAAEPASDPAGRSLPPAGEPLEQGDEHGQEGQQRQAEEAQARGKGAASREDRAEPDEENLRQELGHGRQGHRPQSLRRRGEAREGSRVDDLAADDGRRRERVDAITRHSHGHEGGKRHATVRRERPAPAERHEEDDDGLESQDGRKAPADARQVTADDVEPDAVEQPQKETQPRGEREPLKSQRGRRGCGRRNRRESAFRATRRCCRRNPRSRRPFRAGPVSGRASGAVQSSGPSSNWRRGTRRRRAGPRASRRRPTTRAPIRPSRARRRARPSSPESTRGT